MNLICDSLLWSVEQLFEMFEEHPSHVLKRVVNFPFAISLPSKWFRHLFWIAEMWVSASADAIQLSIWQIFKALALLNYVPIRPNRSPNYLWLILVENSERASVSDTTCYLILFNIWAELFVTNWFYWVSSVAKASTYLSFAYPWSLW